MPTPLSLVVTTLDNAATIGDCLTSAGFVDQVLVLDSNSSDDTRVIAESLGAEVVSESFRGYGPQKARAVALAANDWVLLLDADETLSEQLATEIKALASSGFEADGYRLLREEWLYWRWPRDGTALTDHLRLFDRRTMTMGEHPVHAAPHIRGTVQTLRGRLRHHGQASLHEQVERVNAYTSDAADWNGEHRSFLKIRLVLAPFAAFFREYIVRRQFLNGWAGLIAARVAAFHATLRYAKAIEAQRGRSGRGG